MNPVMYILMPSDEALKMSEGKARAQAGHAAVEAYRLSCKGDGGNFQESSIANRWRMGGHYAKIVLRCEDLFEAERYINERGFKTAFIIDEGRTEFGNRLTSTAIGVEIVDKDSPHVQATFGQFPLWKPTPKPTRWEEFKKGMRLDFRK